MRELSDILATISADPRLAEIYDQAHSGDNAHGVAHTLRVTLTALSLSEGELPTDEVIAAGLLHDLIDIPKNAPDRALASERSAERARAMLETAGFAPASASRIADAIRDHSYSRGACPQDYLAQILQDADRLDALGAIGIFRAVSVGDKMGSAYYDPADPWAFRRELDEPRYIIDHFFVKLLRLPERMNTVRGRAEALARARFMELFLDQFGAELGVVRASASMTREPALVD